MTVYPAAPSGESFAETPGPAPVPARAEPNATPCAASLDAVAQQHAVRHTRTLAQYARAESLAPAERRRIHDDVIVDYLGVAETIARRYSSGIQDWRDIRQVAYLGLVKAARRFDPDRGDDFVSFAVPTISGEIKRHLRDHGWFVRPPRPIQELSTSIARAVPALLQDLGHQPSPEEIAERVGHEAREVTAALGAAEGMRPVSLDAPGRDADGRTVGESVGAVDDRLEHAEVMAEVTAACRRLTARDRRIVYLRFYEERTQQEIASELGVTQMQVSRLLNRILSWLREELSPAGVVA
jgi:RNA polymerase sigma-B factor